ncbi:c-Myc-binding protein-like [Ursus arctos]|uniref:c-Myc-binding protein-like n=1 Tax=Ursus arctos TaxID=9644 RepID=UPI0020171DCE|nr:c-Myc-binding protein-like [Ursus arctos]
MKPFNKSPYIKNKNNSSYIKIPVTGAHQTVAGTGYAAAAVPAARYKADHSKREQFWRYLKKSGVVDTLTKKVLVALYEEPGKPNSALDFLKHHLEAANPENPEIGLLRLQLAEMKEKYKAIVEENKKLNINLAQYEPPEEGKHAE